MRLSIVGHREYGWIGIDPLCYVLAAALIYLMSLKWLMAWFLAAVVHELCHFAALCALGVRVAGISVDIWGAKMHLPSMSNSAEAISTLAGPAGGAILVVFVRRFPELAVCALIQTVYNLLPLYPLDGGRILSCILRSYFKFPLCESIRRWIERGVMLIILLISPWIIKQFHTGWLPMLVSVTTVLKHIIKIPCKQWEQIVQ